MFGGQISGVSTAQAKVCVAGPDRPVLLNSSETGSRIPAAIPSSVITNAFQNLVKSCVSEDLNFRMGGRVVEGGSLENCCTCKGTLGSNPSPSALCHTLFDRQWVMMKPPKSTLAFMCTIYDEWDASDVPAYPNSFKRLG